MSKTKTSKQPKPAPVRVQPVVRRNIFKLCVVGQQLSNVAYNWKQDTNRPEEERKMLADLQRQWDEARDRLPRWVSCA